MNLFNPQDSSPPGIPVQTVNIDSSMIEDQFMDDGTFISTSLSLQVNAVTINDESSSGNEEPEDGPFSDEGSDIPPLEPISDADLSNVGTTSAWSDIASDASEGNDDPESDFSQDKEGASNVVAHAPESKSELHMERDFENQVGMMQPTGKQNRKKTADEEKGLGTLTHTSTIPHAAGRIVPWGIIPAVKIEGHACHTLMDSGLYTDPISASLVNQLIEGQDFGTGDIIALYSAKLSIT
ncbi:hypothetical protein FISHEDRAFT_75874 [Fistulina hepatica ATCC 64428]|uniref:Uncharacterized protein n=1 Tax=Fistulina hepatica ATCC 64428 TaxID=1128425 RepID=A0A0D7A7X3_9AGAR|nr:hypothetical protein FISHEDRAFT_75874 [Fistulina hepatica ATCC 64428]